MIGKTFARSLTLACLTLASYKTCAMTNDQSENEPLPDITIRLELALMPEEVLASSIRHFPEIAEALALQQAAHGDVQAAQGGFDLQLKAEAYDRIDGFWTGAVAKTEARQNLRNYGAQIYGGYRLSDGTFPIYEDINFTNTLGELKIGAIFSLLKDRKTDRRRFGLRDTKLAAEQAKINVLLTQIEIQQKALNAYWRWVAAGRELEVYRALSKTANDRQIGLQKQVQQGAKSDIDLVENQQNIIRRQVFVVQAQRNFTVASNALSFYFRDDAGNLKIAKLLELPATHLLPEIKSAIKNDTTSVSDKVAQRPELRNLQVAIKRAQNKIAISENNLKPKLDLNFEVSRDFGDVAEGGLSRDSTDTIIGLSFEVPLQRRAAKGQLSRAEAELRAARLKASRIQDKIEVEFSNILADLTTTLELTTLARQETKQSALMVVAERAKFRNGASDFFLVNLREETAADAQIRTIRAELNSRVARTSYDAATMNTTKLGIQTN